MKKPIEVAILGAGNRSVLYAKYAIEHPDRMKIVAVAEPDPTRRAQCATTHSIPPENVVPTWEDLAARPKFADAIMNGTMDRMHFDSTVPFLRKGYHVLLEKPIAPTAEEVRGLIAEAKSANVIVMICHVLRYAPLYRKIREILTSGRIGKILSLHSAEDVCYHHMVAAFVRGKWNKREINPIMLAKCCHDLDLIAWMFSGIAPVRVSSFGSNTMFRPEMAPPGAPMRCLDGCPVEATCPYSAVPNYADSDMWTQYAFEDLEGIANPTREQKIESLRTVSPHGRCVYHCGCDIADHQSMIVEFENGATASHDLFSNVPMTNRTMHIVGTLGDIHGDLTLGEITVRTLDPTLPGNKFYIEEKMPAGVEGDMHGGGDFRLVEDFINALSGEATSPGATRIEDSLAGHLIAFAADTAMTGRTVVEIGQDA
ncbi:MAG: Gfo/Idh/MocA family protein [Terrimicrobiaceae bacterium]